MSPNCNRGPAPRRGASAGRFASSPAALRWEIRPFPGGTGPLRVRPASPAVRRIRKGAQVTAGAYRLDGRSVAGSRSPGRWCENVAGYYGSCRPAPKCRCGATPRMPAPTSGKRWSTPSRSGSVHLEGLMTTLAILVALIVLVRLTSLPNFLRFASLHPDQDEDDNGQREHECSDGRDATGLNCPRIVIPAVNGA